MAKFKYTAIDQSGKEQKGQIKAESEEEARRMAHENAGNENKEGSIKPWLRFDYSTCKVLLSEGESEMIMIDFHAA